MIEHIPDGLKISIKLLDDAKFGELLKLFNHDLVEEHLS